MNKFLLHIIQEIFVLVNSSMADIRLTLNLGLIKERRAIEFLLLNPDSFELIVFDPRVLTPP